MRALAIGLVIALIVFLATAGHVVFLPVVFLPIGLFAFGHRRQRRRPELSRRGGLLR